MSKLLFHLFWFAFFLTPALAISQDCLEQLDSANYYSKVDRVRALYFADQLIAKLDSGLCRREVGYAEAYNNIGLVYLGFAEHNRAIRAIQNSLKEEVAQYDSLSPGLIKICLNLSTAYQNNSDYLAAESYLLWADSLVRRNYSEQSPVYLDATYKNGLFYMEVGQYEKSRLQFERALKLTSQYFSENDSIKGALLTEYGTLLRDMGDFEEGEIALNQAIEALKGKNEVMHLRALDRLAAIKLDRGEFSASESQLLSNLQLKKERYPSDSLIRIETLNSLAVLYFKVNDLITSEAYFEDLLNYAGSRTEISPYITNNIGAIYSKRKDYKQAFTMFQESAVAMRELYGGVHPDYANVLSNLANCQKSLGDINSALNMYMRVLDLDKTIYGPENPRYATTLNNIALIYQAFGYVELSEKLLLQALNIRKEKLGEKHPMYAKSLNDLGVHFLNKGDTLQALGHFDEALKTEIHHMQSVFPVLTDQQRQLFFEDTKFNLERFASISFGKRYFETEWTEKVYNYYLNTKSVLFYAADKMRTTMLENPDPVVKNSFIKWREAKYMLAQSYLLSEHELALRGINIASLEEQCNNLEKKMALLSSTFSSQSELSFYSWQDVEKNIADSAVLVEVIEFRNYSLKLGKFGAEQGFDDQSSYVVFILQGGSNQLKRIKLDGSEQLVDQYSFYKNSLRYGLEDASSYNVFWKKIDTELRTDKKVYYAPDGIYHKLNPAILYDSATQQYVSDKYKLVHITSGKDFIQEGKVAANKMNTAAIFGNPDFTTLNLTSPLNPLPEAEREADDVTEILQTGKWKVSDFYYLSATESNLKLNQDPGILHLATHGYFEEGSKRQSALLNSGVYLAKDKSTEDDGILTAYEAMNLKLDQTRLVVLSACETALGAVKNGEGVYGLQRAFLVAGASNLIISLVKVNDTATKNFMNMFYSEFVKEHSIEDSFFTARQRFKEQYPDPFTWGAFILVAKK
ncbi:MAG: CHAT domain-containing protein [Imperialibacter sp.]|uniref:CHAT domain-containing protein n=1 Tax=Imperialibacter sp. TaxID=2038411 RepID=UPI0032EDEB3D